MDERKRIPCPKCGQTDPGYIVGAAICCKCHGIIDKKAWLKVNWPGVIIHGFLVTFTLWAITYVVYLAWEMWR